MNLGIRNSVLTLVAAVLILGAASWAADDNDKNKDRSDIDKRIQASANVLDEIMETPDKAIPDSDHA